VDAALVRQEKDGGTVGLLFVDLDDFKQVNDRHGHAAGDHLLTEVAHRLRRGLRRDDLAGRIGGDEFAVLLASLSAVSDGELVGRRVLAALAEPVIFEGHVLSAAASVGLATSGPGELRSAELLRRADVAMYAAKSSGKDCLAVHDPAMTPHAADAELTAGLRTALSEGQLELEYQPIIDMRTGRMFGAEALVRWNHPVRGRLSAGEFLAAADAGVAAELDRHILREACRQVRTWQERFRPHPPLAVSVNVSARQLRRDSVVEEVLTDIVNSGCDPSCVILDVDESAIIDELAGVAQTFDALQRAGVQLAIDDVGTGYADLEYLRRLPIDILKITPTFVAALGGDRPKAAQVRTVVQQGAALRLTVIAEGVESQLEVDRLLAAGCHMGQGYHLGRPVDAAGIAAMLGGPGKPHEARAMAGRASSPGASRH
jgi:diguanylate cyclase (GGDEF)-like protein